MATRASPRGSPPAHPVRRACAHILERALAIAEVPVKQAVIAPSAISLIYPQDGIDGYPREQSIDDS